MMIHSLIRVSIIFLTLSLLVCGCKKTEATTKHPVDKTLNADNHYCNYIKHVEKEKTDSIYQPKIKTEEELQRDEKEQDRLLKKFDLDTYPKARYKIFYGQSYGYDSFDHRYGYTIMIIDSTIYVLFHCPENETWRALKYEKSYPFTEAQHHRLDSVLLICKLRPKKPIVGVSPATGTASYRLIIQTDKKKLDGYVEWGTVFSASDSKNQYELNKEIRTEKDESSSISGDYEKFIRELEKLFPRLSYLKKKMNKNQK